MNPELLTEQARRNFIVHSGLRAITSPEVVINALVAANEKLMEQYLQALSIAPMRIKTPDGMMVWHCPDELVPIVGER